MAVHYPGADRTARPKGSGNATLTTIDKICLHTTEAGNGLPSYAANWPNLTYDPWRRKWYEHTPINGSSTALANDGSHRTNRANVVQVEIMAYCDPARKSSPYHVSKISPEAVADLGAFVAWMHEQWEVPLVMAKHWTGSSNTSQTRMSWGEYEAFQGVLGHQHVPGNNHYDPGALDVPAIMAAADKILNPAPVYRLFNLNCETPLFASTDAAPWATRSAAIARLVHDQDASIFTAQELGRNEAASLAKALGPRWAYQRAQGDDGRGLNAVLWRDDWTLDTMREWPLPDFGQWTRSLITCKLVHADTGQYVWAASTHLATKGPDLSAAKAVVARQAQVKRVVEIFDPYRQIVMGADLNTRNTDADTLTEQTLRDGGWTLDADELTIAGLPGDRHKGIDAVLTKSRVTLQSVAIVPTGTASDHDARLAAFTVTDPKED